MILLDHRAATRIRDAAQAGDAAVDASLDLGRSTARLDLEPGRVRLPDGQALALTELAALAADTTAIRAVMDDALEKLSWFSDETGQLYTLRATGGWPALEISGILMHRVKDTDPEADAASKVAAIAPVRGRGLDTCCGLGYSAILAARSADHVTVFEIDPNVLEMARLNPWSAPLFETGAPFDIRNDDVADAIRDLPDRHFDFIIHDPPTLARAGDLYGDDFYRNLLRVLRPGGKLFHYTGDPGSRHRRQDLPGRVATRLAGIGFARVRREPEALGVSAARP